MSIFSRFPKPPGLPNGMPKRPGLPKPPGMPTPGMPVRGPMQPPTPGMPVRGPMQPPTPGGGQFAPRPGGPPIGLEPKRMPPPQQQPMQGYDKNLQDLQVQQMLGRIR